MFLIPPLNSYSITDFSIICQVLSSLFLCFFFPRNIGFLLKKSGGYRATLSMAELKEKIENLEVGMR